ncbi:MAG: hypothetical protein KC618_07395, partial [Candidatus Omnitrophica bacterium]|nr:hypothetical protein [Candidatus Omnitrophota bacterium]
MSLKNKLIYIVTTLIVLPMFIMGFVTYRQLRHERIQKELRNVNFAIERKNQFLQYFLNDFKSQVLIFANTPPIQGIIRSRESGVDYMDNSSLEQWKNRWRNIALITLQEKPYIAQIRLINGEGQEVIRVERDKKDNIINIPEEELQEKSGRYYFTET